MALFTGKGDDGTTKNLRSKDRVSKGSCTSEALGTVDELNSFLGVLKMTSFELEKKFENNLKKNLGKKLKQKGNFKIPEKVGGHNFSEMIFQVQQNLFIVQAELAGADKTISEEKVRNLEKIIEAIEKELPPIKSFFISGGTLLAANFDFARTVTRRAERRMVSAHEKNDPEIQKFTLAYMNRLSSLFYAMARLSNHLSGINEEPPTYK